MLPTRPTLASPATKRRPVPRRTRSLRGQSLVELALVLPLFALLLLMAIDFGRAYFTYIQVNNAAREAAHFAATGPNGPTDTAGITTVALQEMDAQSQSGAGTITVADAVCNDSSGTVMDCADAATVNATGQGNTVTVTVTEPFSFLTPFVNNFLGGSFHMSARATATVFGFVALGSSGGSGGSGSCSAPMAVFSVVTDGTLTVTVDPTGSSPNSGECQISGYNWSWGDGTSTPGTYKGYSHDYNTTNGAGTYIIRLDVTNQAGGDFATQTVTVPGGGAVSCTKPHAEFTWSHGSGKTSKVYTYVDASTVDDPTNCPITSWLWTFTDLAAQSNAQNPTPQTYKDNSTHPVTLQVTNAAGTSSITHGT